MSKRVESVLLDAFLHHVLEGQISATINTPAPSVLGEMTEAVYAMLAGDNPSYAFKIKKRSGPEKQFYTVPLAMFIHLELQKEGATWASIEVVANDWRKRRGLKPVSLSRLKDIHKDNKEEVLRIIKFNSVKNLE